ncbi:MAG: PKD-like family lipoprotein [Bacteroidia bacterium]|nr:PKD-like family lipoprotein [Bacteroidia bacterium]
MKRIYYLILSAVICLSFLSSCYDDMGNYNYLNYNKIEEVKAEGITSVALGDTIKIRPVIKWKYPDRDTTAFDFRWELNDSVISNQRNLIYIPNIATTGRGCTLYITERSSGIVTIYSTSISVLTSYRTGWVVLAEEEGKSILSYVRRDTKTNDKGEKYFQYVEYKDIYNTLFEGAPLGTDPKRLFYMQVGNKDEILVLQNPNESVYLSGEDFSKKTLLTDEFSDKKYPAGFIPREFVDAVYCNYLVGENGQVYWRVVSNYAQHVTRFFPEPLYHTQGLNVAFFPNIRLYGDVFMTYMYDKQNNKMYARSTMLGTDAGALMRIVNNAKPEGVADITNFGNYQLIYMGGDKPNYMMILKDKTTGEYVYHSFREANDFRLNLTISRHFQEPFTGGPLITENTKFLHLRKTNYLFFGEGSKLYFYDRATKRVKLYHDFGSGNIVKIAPEAYETELGVALDNGSLYVCSTKIEVLAADNPGAEGGILHHITGLGKIVDLIWKYGGSYPLYI